MTAAGGDPDDRRHHAEDFYLEAGPLRPAVDYLLHFSSVTPASLLTQD